MNLETKSGNVSQTEKIRDKISAELDTFGIPKVPEIVDHFVVLEENSGFDADSRDICNGVKGLLEVESFGLKIIEKKRIILAARLHDIGKSSSSKDVKTQRAVTRLFAKENINPDDKVTKVLQLHFPPEEIDDIILSLLEVEVGPGMKMRDFWDKHAFWTKDILDRFSGIFDQETKIIAASHHLDRNINPYKIDIKKVSKELKYSIFLLMAMDKYQAYRVRGKLDHQESMKSLRTVLGQYDNDPIMDLIIKTIDQLGSIGNMFTKNISPAIASIPRAQL